LTFNLDQNEAENIEMPTAANMAALFYALKEKL